MVAQSVRRNNKMKETARVARRDDDTITHSDLADTEALNAGAYGYH
jgi:hypothetical protein